MASAFTKPDKPLTWLITGCSSGFGLSLARIVQSAGHNVIATSRNPDKTPELVAEVERRGGRWLQLDVSSPHCGSIVGDLEKDSATAVDVLVNNAGFNVFSVVESAADADVRSMMETMYLGPLRLIQAVLPGMRRRGFGVVANFSSGASLEGNPSMGVYAGIKAALDCKHYTRPLLPPPGTPRTLMTH